MMTMDTIIKIIGIIIVCIGIVFLVKPQVTRYLMGFFKKGSRIYLAGLVRFALAIIFLLGARGCGIPWVIALFGILFMVSGILVFMLGPARLGPLIDWFQKQSLLLVRAMAVLMLAVGAVIIYAA